MTKKTCLAGVLFMLAAPATANEHLQLSVSPRISSEPGYITIRAAVEPDADNRAITVVAESANFYRSSQTQLEGDQGARLNVFTYRNLPVGDYQVSVRVLGADGRARALAVSRVKVVR